MATSHDSLDIRSTGSAPSDVERPMSGVLKGRRVLVAGASSGIGAAAVRACAEAGARVCGLARRGERLVRLHEETGACPIIADVRDVDQVARGLRQAVDVLGGLDAVINSAGVMRLGSFENGNLEDWRMMFDVNVLGLLTVTRAVIPLLREAGGGDIVNIGSMAARRPPEASGGVYSATKSAVHVISEAVRRELHGTGIRVTIVAPGMVETELRRDVADEELRKRAQYRGPLIGIPPQAVARVIVNALAEPPEINHWEIALLPTAQGTS